MKKLAFLISLFAIAIFVVACGDQQATNTSATDGPKTEEHGHDHDDDSDHDHDNEKGHDDDSSASVVTENDTYKTVILEDGIPSPLKKMTGKIGETTVTVTYGSPSLRDRDILTLTPHGELWRTGANMCTTIEVSKDVMIEGEKLTAGKYSIFTIPNKDEWVIAFNTDTDQGGTRSYKEDKDALRINVKPTALSTSSEAMEFVIDGSSVALQWGNVKVPFAVSAS